MAVKIRLARHGAKKAPFYRVVVADGRSKRDGRFIEIIGRYDPRTEPSTVELDVDKATAWIEKGAQPTEAVEKLIAIAKGEKEIAAVEAKPSKKAQAKAAEEAEAAATASEEAAAAPPAPEEAPAEDAGEPAAEDVAADVAEPEEAPAADEAAETEPPAESAE